MSASTWPKFEHDPEHRPGAERCRRDAAELLEQCLSVEPWDPRLVESLAREECCGPLFSILAEGLADRFEPRLCDHYAEIFSCIFARELPGYTASDLLDRYRRVRHPRVCDREPETVYVLSRVTLGADIAVTSVLLDALKRRFPHASICLVGSAKVAELFARDPRITPWDVPYPRRGTLSARLAIGRDLAARFNDERAIVVDPDSRLTQLGLLPVCDESRYFFFESRASGGAGSANLSELAADWAANVFNVTGARPYIAPLPREAPTSSSFAALSLGVGGNAAKSLSPDFEADLVRLLCRRFPAVIVDAGSGPEEAVRARHAVAGTNAQTWNGTFAEFAALLTATDCYVGYDSAAQHAAAALGVPLLTLFKGFVSDRMFARWQPSGPGPKEILKVEESVTLDSVSAALDRLLRKS